MTGEVVRSAAASATGPTGLAAAAVPRRFWLAAFGAAAVVVVAAAMVVGAATASPEDFLSPLVAAAALSAAVLARRWAPALAWLALIVAAVVATSVPLAVSSGADPGALGLWTWLLIAARSSAAAVVTAAIAGLYATRPERRGPSRLATLVTFLVAWLAAACLLVVVLVFAGARYDPAFTWIDLATWPTSVFFQIVLVLTAFGVASDLRAAAALADRRLEVDLPDRPDRRALLAARLRGTLRELVPGQAAADEAAIEAERVRLAGDLHAVVLPTLRKAIADAEAGGPIDALAERLRTVDLELERLMADRWPVVLEAFGLVEALEDLAERTEADGSVEVELSVESAGGRPRPEIERAAWRAAQLAVDNAIRHAAASRISIVIAVSPERVALSVGDDGRGFDPADSARTGARGLADLSRRAAAVGAAVAIESSPDSGSIVRFAWPAIVQPTR